MEDLKSGLSVVFFPEGRITKVPISPFKKGAFVLAIQMQVPILPIGLVGYPRDYYSRGIPPKIIKCIIGKPIETKDLMYKDRNYLKDLVEKEIMKLTGYSLK